MSWRRVVNWTLGVGFVIVLVPTLWFALKGQDWSAVTAVARQGDRGRIGWLLAGALLSTMVGPVLGMLSWRALIVDLGAPVTTAQAIRLFGVGFFSKYMPVKGLALIVAARLAKTSGVSLGRFFGAGTLSLGVTVLTGLGVGLLAGIEVFGARAAWLVLALLPTVFVALRPQIINWAVAQMMRLFRRQPPDAAVSARGMRRSVGWQTLAWLVSGLHLWLLALAMNAAAGRSLALCVGAFSLATAIGILVIVVPDGIGVRESILMAALALVLPVPAAAVVVLASRLVTTVSEIALGVVAMTAAEIVHRRRIRSVEVSHG